MTHDTRSSGSLLAADVGGTKTLFGLFAPEVPRPAPVVVERVPTSADASFQSAVDAFLERAGRPSIAAAVFGIAGPVAQNQGRLTNHSWIVDGPALANHFGAPVGVLNDLEALAYALDVLHGVEMSTVQVGTAVAHGPLAVLAAGTGLGAAVVVRAGGQPIACASESGHADFAPRNAREDELVHLLRAQFGRATVEHVLSGRGLVRLHHLSHDGRVCPWMAGVPEHAQPAAVTASALARQCSRCEDALAMFVSVFGSEAGNLALRSLPRGGLYLGGGIAVAIEPALHSQGFLDAFLDKHPMRSLLEDIPIRLVRTPEAGLLGAAVWGQRHLL